MAQTKKLPSATFKATVTPSVIEKGNTAQGVRYSKMPAATILRKNGQVLTRTVMAFGRANADVFRSLKPGKPVELECKLNGGTVYVVGKVKPPAPAAQAAA